MPRRDKPNAARPRRLLLRLAAGLLVVALLAVGDLWLRNRELDALLTAVEASEAAQVAGAREIGSKRRSAAEAFGPARDAFVQESRKAATDAEAAAIATSAAVQDVGVMPWHRPIGRARSRYLAHARAWEQAFRDLAAEQASSDQSGRISGTFSAAEAAFLDAVPVLPMHDAEDRISQVFTD